MVPCHCPRLAPGDLKQEPVRGPWSLDREVVLGVLLSTASENAQACTLRGSRRTDKVRTSISAASTCTGATPGDTAAKVMPPQESSTRNPHEEVIFVLILNSAVSSKAYKRKPKVRPVGTVDVRPGQCRHHVKPLRELGEKEQRLPFGQCSRKVSLLPCHLHETCEASVHVGIGKSVAGSSQKERGVVRPKSITNVSVRGG